MSALRIRIHEKSFAAVGRADAHVALADLRLEVAESEFVCLLGPSGCGKTTLLNCVAGLDRDFDGTIEIQSTKDSRDPVIGYVFQNPRLLPWLTVAENIELVLNPGQRASGLAKQLIEETGLGKFRNTYPARLSLGMERRVALVRAFAVQPDILLLDEPFVSLDEPTARRLRRLLRRIWNERPTTIVFVTHDLREAIQLSQRIVLLSPAPARVVADVAVGLNVEQRDDEAAVEALRGQFIRQNPGYRNESS